MMIAAPRVLATVALATRAMPRPLHLTAAPARARTLCASAMLPPHLEDLKEELASGEAVLFDVREPNEAAAGMLRDAVLVPLAETVVDPESLCDDVTVDVPVLDAERVAVEVTEVVAVLDE